MLFFSLMEAITGIIIHNGYSGYIIGQWLFLFNILTKETTIHLVPVLFPFRSKNWTPWKFIYLWNNVELNKNCIPMTFLLRYHMVSYFVDTLSYWALMSHINVPTFIVFSVQLNIFKIIEIIKKWMMVFVVNITHKQRS